MRKSHRWLFPVFFAVVLGVVSGCSSSPTSDIRTAAQYFKEHQVNTMTPHGRVMVDSVEERDDKIRYKTEDGKRWQVAYSKRADGTYQYGTPDEVK